MGFLGVQCVSERTSDYWGWETRQSGISLEIFTFKEVEVENKGRGVAYLITFKYLELIVLILNVKQLAARVILPEKRKAFGGGEGSQGKFHWLLTAWIVLFYFHG